MISQEASVGQVHGVGAVAAEKLEKLGIRTVGDLLRWYPREYLDGSQPVPIARLPLERLAAIEATVEKFQERPTKNRRLKMVDVTVSDESGSIVLRWFNQGYLKQKLVPESRWTFMGMAKRFNKETFMMAPLMERKPRILPVYAQTAGVTSKMLRGYLEWCLASVNLEEAAVPELIRQEEDLRAAGEVLRMIHSPSQLSQVAQARRQLAFEEAFWFFTRMAAARTARQDDAGIPIAFDEAWFRSAVAGLPFELTPGQKRAVWDSLQDMQKAVPMTRLLNGDVGSGKTAVAALIAAAVAHAGYQSILLAPTELLVRQHAASIAKLLEPLGLKIALYTASHKDPLEGAQIAVGTHALLRQREAFPRLAFVTVDEQHRFGVRQRQALREGAALIPHLLSLTATPIPRTLALSLYGDLSLSMLADKPAGRLPILTEVVRESGRPAMYKRVMQELSSGRQVFVICPLIEEKPGGEAAEEGAPTLFTPDETAAAEKKTVAAETERLRREFPEFGTVEMLHGKMKPAEKEAVMARMAAGEVGVLVATSVVEVGVDIPNASVIIIEGAERFGMAQLHQFRGRVGRSGWQSYCFLCPSARGATAMARLQAVAGSDNGFELAQTDLEQRGPGELVGISQSGLPDFKMASLTDLELLARAKAAVASAIVKIPNFLADYSKQAFGHEESGAE